MTTIPEFKTPTEIRDYLWQALNLSTRSVTFTLFCPSDDDRLFICGGIVDCSEDLYEDDRFFEMGLERSDDVEISIDTCEAYMIGDGESEHADTEEAMLIECIAEKNPDAFDLFINKYADPMVTIRNFTVDNPGYCMFDDDDDKEDDTHE